MNIPDTNLDATIAAQHETSGGNAGSGNAAALGAADWLSLAAAPTFAIMALLTGVLGGGPSATLCSAAQGASPLSGMVAMYLLMSAFHVAPWLKLVLSRTKRGRGASALCFPEGQSSWGPRARRAAGRTRAFSLL
jgi:hypothetical protein